MKTSIFRSPSCSRFMEHAFERDWPEEGQRTMDVPYGGGTILRCI
jgi:hypothetical protein